MSLLSTLRLFLLGVLTLALLGGVGSCRKAGSAEAYDLVILNGRVLDPETGLDEIRNIGIRGDSIAVVTTAPIRSDREINASGRVVVPGFVDLHSHAVTTLFGSRMQVLDGVTTQLELENGILPVADWYDRLAAEGRPANYGASASWTFARIEAMEGMKAEASASFFFRAQALERWKSAPAQELERERIMTLLEDALNAGAIGIGVNAGYAPGYEAHELLDIHKLAASRPGLPVVYHMRQMGRGPSGSALASLMEIIGLTQTAGNWTHICHMHSTSTYDLEAVRAAFMAARSKGVHLTSEVYPYGAGSTVIGAAFLRSETFSQQLGYGPENIIYLPTGEIVGDIGRLRTLQDEDPGGLIVNHFLDLSDPARAHMLDRAVSDPALIIASDAMFWLGSDRQLITTEWPGPAGAMAHPRSAGAFSRFFGVYVREKQMVSLMDAVRRTSFEPAKMLSEAVPSMRRKGRIQQGADADIVVFDLDAIGSPASFEVPAQQSVGIDAVIVGGQIVVYEGILDEKSRPGRPIRTRVPS